ncbi:MAG TPA: hypothetical protein VGD01_06355 [Candidatus Elarobacter sp.]
MNANELIGKGLYSPAEAARLIRVPARKVRRWLYGVHDSSHGVTRDLEPLTDTVFALATGDYLTFEGFIELLAVRAFRAEGVSMATIRRAHDKARSRYHTTHPFASRPFFTDEKSIFASLAPKDASIETLEELTRSQLAFKRVIAPALRNIDFTENRASRYWPKGHTKHVVIDSERQFGKPIDPVSGVPTYALAAAYRAEAGNVAVVARWYNVTNRAVRDAVSFEAEIAQAA